MCVHLVTETKHSTQIRWTKVTEEWLVMISLVSPSIGTDEDNRWTMCSAAVVDATVVDVVVHSIGGGDMCKLKRL